MLAISNSSSIARQRCPFHWLKSANGPIWAPLLATLISCSGCMLSFCEAAFGDEPNSSPPNHSPQSPLDRARKAFTESEARFKTSPTNDAAAWQFARACFDLADLAAKDAERADLANRGITACRQTLERDPKNS